MCVYCTAEKRSPLLCRGASRNDAHENETKIKRTHKLAIKAPILASNETFRRFMQKKKCRDENEAIKEMSVLESCESLLKVLAQHTEKAIARDKYIRHAPLGPCMN